MSDAAEHLRSVLASARDPAALLANLMAGSPIGYLIYDTTGRPVVWNRATTKLLGSEPSPRYSLLEDPVAQRLGGTDAFRGALAGVATDSPAVWWDPRDAAIEQDCPEDELPPSKRNAIQVTYFPLRDGDGAVRYVVQTYQDLTELMQHREHLEAVVAQRTAELRSALADVERLYTETKELDRLKSTFTANVSHELRTP